jgi:hypothetical protein
MSTATLPGDSQWTTQPAAAAFIGSVLDELCSANSALGAFRHRLAIETGTRLRDWVAHLSLPTAYEEQLEAVGYQPANKRFNWYHPGGLFPTIELDDLAKQLFLKVESVSDFVFTHRLMNEVHIEGVPVSPVRRALIANANNVEWWVLERHGSTDLAPSAPPYAQLLAQHAEVFRMRRRLFDDEAMGFEETQNLIAEAIVDLGVDRTCDLFFFAEREYWQLRNKAARIQKARQDAIGLGWANHDHHTYRSSREHFVTLMAICEQLGFLCRERFYAGKDAGWGAQVLEQPNTGVIIFADVDLSPEEVTGDFAHEPLAPRAQLGTVGLWCKLHGEAFLQAGMHHLECQFDFNAAREQLQPLGVNTMKPFTDFEYLRQAFTQGEVWPVAEDRIVALLADGRITIEQATKFRTQGALGSHLEILQRNDGYKGFNQTGINEIILGTDPRRQ